MTDRLRRAAPPRLAVPLVVVVTLLLLAAWQQPGSTFAAPAATGSASPSPSSSPGNVARTVTLTAKRSNVAAGARDVLRGYVASPRSGCNVHAPIEIRRRVHGHRRFRPFRNTMTDRTEHYRLSIRIRKSADYVAVAPQRGACLRAKSAPVTVGARVRIRVTVSDPSPPRYADVTIHGRVRPPHPRTAVVLQWRRGGNWRTYQGPKPLSGRSTFTFSVFAQWSGSRTFRVVWPRADYDHERGTSRTFHITT